MVGDFVMAPEDCLLLQRFDERRLEASEWSHEMHVRIGWLHFKRFGAEAGIERLRFCIRRLNQAHGVPNSDTEGYHETLTRFWVALIARAEIADAHSARTSAEFVTRHPALLDPRRPFEHYHRTTLFSLRARRRWVLPDLEPLPSPA